MTGPNGAGTSTLLKRIFNLVNIASGHILRDEDERFLPPW